MQRNLNDTVERNEDDICADVDEKEKVRSENMGQ